MANEPLKNSIENLYRVFAKYPLKEKIEGCPCCVNKKDNRILHSKPLRQLSAEDLSYYGAKALTTFGDEDDFKHFLPRLFEVISQGESSCYYGEEILIGKLEYAKWQNWNQIEKSAIENFFTELIRFASNFDKERAYLTETYLVGIANAVEDITPYLNLWLEEISLNKIITLNYFIFKSYYGMSNAFLAGRQNQRKQIKDWLISEEVVSILENLFFTSKTFQQLNELSDLLDLIYSLKKST